MEKYKEIAIDIQKDILNRQLEQDDKLPIIDQLVDQYQVSKATIIKALDILEIRGVIYQRRGSGIFVRRPQKPNYFNLVDKYGFKHNNSNMDIQGKVISFETVPANSDIAKSLQVDLGSNLFHIQRLQSIDGQPVCIENSYYVQAIFPDLTEEIASQSIFEYIIEESPHNIGFSDNYLKIDYLDKQQAQLLQVDPSSPCLLLEETYYLQSGIPFNYSCNYFSNKYGKFSIPTSQFTSI